MPKRVAVFGGTFDPIHEGHVQLALQFARRLKLDEVLLVPTFVPPHKLKADMAAAEDRLAMCRLVAAAHPKLKVSDMEITRGGASLCFFSNFVTILLCYDAADVSDMVLKKSLLVPESLSDVVT